MSCIIFSLSNESMCVKVNSKSKKLKTMSTLSNRRDFFKMSAAGALGVMVLGPLGCKPAPIDRKTFGVGIQLYTLRDAMAADALGSLKKLSDLGYKNLELANYADGKFYGFAPKELKKEVSNLWMTLLNNHTQV